MPLQGPNFHLYISITQSTFGLCQPAVELLTIAEVEKAPKLTVFCLGAMKAVDLCGLMAEIALIKVLIH